MRLDVSSCITLPTKVHHLSRRTAAGVIPTERILSVPGSGHLKGLARRGRPRAGARLEGALIHITGTLDHGKGLQGHKACPSRGGKLELKWRKTKQNIAVGKTAQFLRTLLKALTLNGPG